MNHMLTTDCFSLRSLASYGLITRLNSNWRLLTKKAGEFGA